VALLACAPPAGSGPYPDPLPPEPLDGVQLHPFWSDMTPRRAVRQLNIARRANADVVRVDIAWSSLELERNNDFSRGYARRVDAFLNDARRRGIKVIAVLNETPCWASRAPRRLRRGCRGAWWERGVTRYPPRRAKDYADAAAYVARRWGRQLTALEIWNEPNAPNFLISRDQVRDYSRLVRASYRPVKRAAPRLKVLAGSLATADGDFLTDLYERGGIRGRYDAIAYHPYTDGADPAAEEHERGRAWSMVRGTAWLHDIMREHGDPRGELWATEAGASTCRRSVDSACVSERTQASRVAAYLRVARRFRYLRAIVIYNLRDKGSNPRDREDRFGLVRRNLKPKPAFRAFREAAR
jgi:hypothetical protein